MAESAARAEIIFPENGVALPGRVTLLSRQAIVARLEPVPPWAASIPIGAPCHARLTTGSRIYEAGGRVAGVAQADIHLEILTPLRVFGHLCALPLTYRVQRASGSATAWYDGEISALSGNGISLCMSGHVRMADDLEIRFDVPEPAARTTPNIELRSDDGSDVGASFHAGTQTDPIRLPSDEGVQVVGQSGEVRPICSAVRIVHTHRCWDGQVAADCIFLRIPPSDYERILGYVCPIMRPA